MINIAGAALRVDGCGVVVPPSDLSEEEGFVKSGLILLAFIWLLLPHAALGDDGGARHSCQVCGMYTDDYATTAAQLVRRDGRRAHTCGVACMLRIVQDAGGPGAFLTLQVHDWPTGDFTPAAQATYVIGSRVIPDMIPNIIAFESPEEARAFREQEGGEVIDFTQALSIISPMGMTNPTRIKPAVLPPRGAFGVGLGSMKMVMDDVQIGSDSEDPQDFVRRPTQMMGPRKMTSRGEMLMLNYGLTDRLTLSLNGAYLEKEMEMYQMGGAVTRKRRHSGLADTEVSLRYNLWKDSYYRNFFSLLGGVTVPTGDFDGAFLSMPGLQLGTEAFGFTGGLLYTHRHGHLWFHFLTSYTAKLENDYDYQFGDVARVGAALHYTPNYNLMLGLEVDGVDRGKNELNGSKIGNTGGFRSALTAIAEWRFLTALGGNFNLRLSGGIPLYEDLNHDRMGSGERVQLGGGYFASVMVNFKRRFPRY